MPALSVRFLAFAIGVAMVAVAAPADAKTARHPHKHAVASHRAKAATPRCRGADLFPCGPVYSGNHYLGDDPDPFIRSQLLRTYGHSASLF
jgi:hypothetical protein